MSIQTPSPAGSLRNFATIIGALALLPAVFIITVGVSAFVAPQNPVYQAMARWTADLLTLHWFNLLSPIVILGGTALAFGLNLLSMLRVKLHREDSEWVGEVRFRLNRINIGFICVSLLLTAILLAYVVTENWACIIGQKLTC